MTDKTIPFSLLDLAPIPEGSSAKEAFSHSLDLARLAERRGYHRYWLAEHHNMTGIASAATSVLIGYLAASLTTLSFLPQAIKVIATRNTQGISGLMYIMFVCGLVMWLIYGVMIEDTAVSMANFMTLVFAMPILIIKFRRG